MKWRVFQSLFWEDAYTVLSAGYWNNPRFSRPSTESFKLSPASEDIIEAFSTLLTSAKKEWNTPDFTVMLNKQYCSVEDTFLQAMGKPWEYRKNLVKAYSQLGLIPKGLECYVNAWSENDHPRVSSGNADGGQFTEKGSGSSSSSSSNSSDASKTPKYDSSMTSSVHRKMLFLQPSQKNLTPKRRQLTM